MDEVLKNLKRTKNDFEEMIANPLKVDGAIVWGGEDDKKSLQQIDEMIEVIEKRIAGVSF